MFSLYAFSPRCFVYFASLVILPLKSHIHLILTSIDLRNASTTPLNFTKSINLAISERGINSMKRTNRPGFIDAIMNETIPMCGRMIHRKNNLGNLTEESQAYDVHGRVGPKIT